MSADASIAIYQAEPSDISVTVYRQQMAWARIGDTAIHPAASEDVNTSLGQLAQIGERLAREARLAGHRYRTELRTTQNRAARQAVAA